MNAAQAIAILSQIKTIETQLTALRVQVEKLVEQEGKGTHTLADLKGITGGQGNFSEEEIDAALYRLTPEFIEEIATLPPKPAQ